MYYRDTYAKIDCDAIAHNLSLLKKQSSKALIAVLKANAYGHNDYWAARTAMESGCCMVAVSSLDEALSLRKQGFYDQILILGHIRPQDIPIAIEQHLSVSVISAEWLNQVVACYSDLRKLIFHIKVDTGMNRIGLKKIEDVHRAIDLILDHNGIPEGIFTHYACADSESKEMCEQQFYTFKEIISACEYPFKWVHAENSAALLSYEDTLTNAARCGLAMYGISPVKSDLDLHPALSLFTHITCVKRIKKGEYVGYGAAFQAKEDCIIATLPIGYADGFLRTNQGRFLYCSHEWIEVVGRICMDQCMVKLPYMLPVGTPVEIISKHCPVTQMAKDLNTIPYEILCILSDRIPRKIYYHQQEVAIINNRLHDQNP